MKHNLNYEDLIIVMIILLGLKGDSCSELEFFCASFSVFLISFTPYVPKNLSLIGVTESLHNCDFVFPEAS